MVPIGAAARRPAAIAHNRGGKIGQNVIEDFNEIARCLNPLCAESLDSGLVWERMGVSVATETRVDWQLLDNLRDLDESLQEDGVTPSRTALGRSDTSSRRAWQRKR